jgi:hypothetical protein
MHVDFKALEGEKCCPYGLSEIRCMLISKLLKERSAAHMDYQKSGIPYPLTTPYQHHKFQE